MSFSPPHSLPQCTWKKLFFVRTTRKLELSVLGRGSLHKSDRLRIFVFSWVNSFEAADNTLNNVTVNSRKIPGEKITLRFSECDVEA